MPASNTSFLTSFLTSFFALLGPAEGGFGRIIEGYMVPINCENSGARCQAATYEERVNINQLVEGGTIRVHPSANSKDLSAAETPIEYLLAHFGTKVQHSDVKIPLTISKPSEACSALESDVKGTTERFCKLFFFILKFSLHLRYYTGKVVLVRRGTCPFIKKAENIQAAGAAGVIIGGLAPYIVRMGVEPRWKGLSSTIPITMVSKRAYTILLAEAALGGSVSFVEDYNVNATLWEQLEKHYNGEGWPRSSTYITKKYEELIAANEMWPDRYFQITKTIFERRFLCDHYIFIYFFTKEIHS